MGLYIASQDNPNLADEAHFYSSRHPSGKGPQLIIQATPGAPKLPRQEWPWNPPEFLPPADGEEFQQWKKGAGGRYHT